MIWIINRQTGRKERELVFGENAIKLLYGHSFLSKTIGRFFLHGFGKALPKNEALLVPFFCDVFVGEAQHWHGDKHSWMDELDGAMHALATEGKFAAWE